MFPDILIANRCYGQKKPMSIWHSIIENEETNESCITKSGRSATWKGCGAHSEVGGSSKLGESEGKYFLEEPECNNEITDHILLSKPHDIADFAQVIIIFCWVEIWSVWCHGLVLKNTKLLEKPPPPSKPKNGFSESPLIGCLNIFRGPPQYLSPPSPPSQSY